MPIKFDNLDDYGDEIAVVGVAARVPGADDVDEFWSNLVEGRGSIVSLTPEQLAAAGVPASAAADPNYIPAWAPVRDVGLFDAELFGITPRDAAGMDPQIRLFLEVAHTALEQSGHALPWADLSVGVYGAAGANRYAALNLPPRSPSDGVEIAFSTLNQSDYVATSLSYRLDLRGPSLTVRTACSSGLVALHLACQALRTGDCDVAVVGGADVELPWSHGYHWSEGGVLSRVGTCRPFDAAADGTVFGSGAVALVLRPLADAVRDGDHIHAVVRGSAVTNDGADKLSFGAPSPAGHARAVVEAMAMAGAHPTDISYVEAHGTGTPLGDPVEVAALTHAYRTLAGARLTEGTCGLGSVKGNVGHLGPVAGLVGLLKTVLALDREQLPPTVGFTEPNPRLGLEESPFNVVDKLTPWPRVAGRTRLAGVSSLGIGGTNAHVVLAEGPSRPPSSLDHRPRLVVWSARTAAACDELAGRISEHVARTGDDELADTVATLQHGRTAHSIRRALVCVDALDARDSLTDATRVLNIEDNPPRVRLPGLTDDEPAAFARLRRDLPNLDRHVRLWSTSREKAGLDGARGWHEPDAWDTTTSFGARVALARTWVETGVAPSSISAEPPFEPALDVLSGQVSDTQAIDMPEAVAPTQPTDEIERAHLEAVASLWVAGEHVDWDSHGLRGPRYRAVLPPSPLAREHYWAAQERPTGTTQPSTISPVWRDVSVDLWADAHTPHGIESGVALLVAPTGGEPARTAVVALRHAGFDVALLSHGDEFGRSNERYTARLDDRDDVTRVLDDLLRRGQMPSLVVNDLTLGAYAGQPGPSLLDTIDVLSATVSALEQRPTWVTLTRDSVDVAGSGHHVAPVAVAALRALSALESSWLDIDDDINPVVLGRQLLAPPRAAALRGRRTWELDSVPFSLPGRPMPLRRGATILVVDPDGAAALSLAEALAQAGVSLKLVVLTAPSAATQEALNHVADAGPRITTVAWRPGTDDLALLIRSSVGRADAIVLVADDEGDSVTSLVRSVAAGSPQSVDVLVAVLRRGGAARGDLPAAMAWRASTDTDPITTERSVLLVASRDTLAIGETLLGALTGDVPDLMVVT